MKSINNLKDSEFFAKELRAKTKEKIKNLDILEILRSGGL